jgi:hypothetical protein
MKHLFLLSLTLLYVSTQVTASENPHVHQLPDLSRSSSLNIPPSKDIDQGLWGELERSYQQRKVSTFDEHCTQVQKLYELQQWYEKEKATLLIHQNRVTTTETNNPTPVRRSFKIMTALKKITTGIIAPVGIIFASQVIPKQPELTQLKTGLQGSGILAGSYLVCKGIKHLFEPDAETLEQIKVSLDQQQRTVTTLKLYLNSFSEQVRRQTTFHQPKNTPVPSGEFLIDSSSSMLDFTPIQSE